MNDDRRLRARPGALTARWYVVLPVLVVTFGAMLFAIYWVVKSARH